MSTNDDLVEIRGLVPSNQVGGIIGKSGSNIAKVREASGAFISILKNEIAAPLGMGQGAMQMMPQHLHNGAGAQQQGNARHLSERIMIFKGSVDQIALASRVIMQLLVDTANERITAKTQQLQEAQQAAAAASTDAPEGANAAAAASLLPSERIEKSALKLLVHRSQVGSIIGKAGVLIKETQELTQTRIQVSNDVLPNSTEKTVNIVGTPDQIQSAMKIIAKCLYENPLPINTKNYMYNPSLVGQSNGMNGANASYANAMGNGMSGLSNAHSSNANSNGGTGLRNNKRMSAHRDGGMQHHHMQHQDMNGMSNGASGVQSTQKIAIPAVCAGTVIGRHGAVIRDLRAQSGTSISIADTCDDSPQERVVTITGEHAAIQSAVYLIRQLVEQYQPQQKHSNNQHQQQQQQQQQQSNQAVAAGLAQPSAAALAPVVAQ